MSAIADIPAAQYFADSTARAAAVPFFVGQIGVQVDTGAIYRGTAVTAGSWEPTAPLPASAMLRPNAGIAPRIPSTVKLKGGNIVLKPTDVRWYGMWGTNWDWTGWIKWQIDLGLSVGMNCFCAIAALEAIYNGTATRAQIASRLTQIASYLQDRGAYFYYRDVTCPDKVTAGDVLERQYLPGATDASLIADWLWIASILVPFPNAIAFDLSNELNVLTPNNITYATNLYAAMKAAYPLMPVTFSHNGTPTDSSWTSGADGFTDFWDYHIYVDLQPQYMGTHKCVIFGEFGANASQSTDDRTTRYSQVLAASQHPDVVGAIQWGIADQDTVSSNQWGLFDNSGTPRSDIYNIFRQFPSTQGPWVMTLTAGTGDLAITDYSPIIDQILYLVAFPTRVRVWCQYGVKGSSADGDWNCALKINGASILESCVTWGRQGKSVHGGFEKVVYVTDPANAQFEATLLVGALDGQTGSIWASHTQMILTVERL